MAKSKNNESDDFSFDLGKIKSFFKSDKSSQEKKSESKDFEFDVSSIKKILLNKTFLTFFLLFIAIFFSVYFRAYSTHLPITDEWASDNVYNSVRVQITNQINQQYPNLPASNKNQLITEQLNDFFAQNSAEANAQIEILSKDLKSRFQDESGQTYLLAIDPYVYLRQTNSLIEHGYVGDVLVNDSSFDNHVMAPLGGFTRNSFHPFFQAYWYKFWSFFGNPSLMKTTFFVPIFLSALAVVPAFFIAKRRVGYFGGFIAAFIVAIHPAFIGRTAGGFADTDAYNVLFPLLIAWVFIEAFESDNWKKQLGLSLLAGFLVGLYSFAWTGWWYIFDFLLASVVAYIIYSIVKSFIINKNWKHIMSKNLKTSFVILILFTIFSGIFVSLFANFDVFQLFFKGPFSFLVIKQAAHSTLWPNVYTTVAELNEASIGSIISQIGGKLFFFIASLGLILTMIKRDDLNKKDYMLLGLGSIIYLLLVTNNFIRFSPIKYLLIFFLPLLLGLFLLLKDKRNIDIKYALFLTIWFVGTIYASTKGTRFVLLLVPAYAIALGISLGTFESILSRLISKEFNVNKKIISGVVIVLLLLLLVNPIKAADRTSKGEIPSMNDGWWATLTKIKNNSTENAIITSWWDFGHWFKAVADRPVTFDGGSQNRPQAHWVGKILLSEDEDQAIGILRMLDCGANNAFDTINIKFADTEKSVDIVYDIIMLEKDDAKDYLVEHGFTETESESILRYTHCEPPEAFFITSGDMVGKAGVWAHFGSWNFDRSYIYNNVKNANQQETIELLNKKFNMTEDEASTYYFEIQSLTTDRQANDWIAPWPNYATPSLRGCKNTSEIVECNIGLGIGESNVGQSVTISSVIINLSNPSDTKFILSFVDRNTGLTVAQQQEKPANLIIADETLERFDVGGTNIFLDVVYDKVTNRALVTHPDLSESMFTRLFYLEGRYTSHFDKFSDLTDVVGSRILVWKVKW